MLNDTETVMIERDAAHLIHPLHNPAAHAGGKVWVGGEGEFLVDANGEPLSSTASRGCGTTRLAMAGRELAEAGATSRLAGDGLRLGLCR